MRVIRFVAAAGIAAVFALAASPATAQSDPAIGDRAEGSYIEYTGTITRVDYDSDGAPQQNEAPAPTTVGIECDDAGCRVYGITIAHDEELTMTGGSAVFSLPGSGSPTCSGGGPGSVRPETITVTATATAISIIIDQPTEGWVDCDGTQTYLWGIVYTIDAEYSAGDPCVLDGQSCVEPEPEPEPEPTADANAGTAGFAAPRGPGEPTVLSSLPTATDVITVPNAIWAAVGTVILVLLLALPTHFFNSATERASELAGAWWKRIRAGRTPDVVAADLDAADLDADLTPSGGTVADVATGGAAAATPRSRGRLSGWPVAALGVVAASVIAAFADPAFAFDAAGARVFLSILISFAIEVVLGWFAVIFLVRRTHPAAAASFQFSPLTLLVVILAVVLTRVTQFEPAIVFGLVAGVAFGGLLGTAERARVALVGLGWSFGIGVLAWIGYSLLAAATASTPEGGLLFVSETLSAAAIAGISALPIALLPLRGLAGRTVWDWNRMIWGAAYAIGLFAFMLVLLPMPFSWAEVGLGLWAWVGLYLLYAAAAVGIWLAVVRPWRTDPAPDPASDLARAEPASAAAEGV